MRKAPCPAVPTQTPTAKTVNKEVNPELVTLLTEKYTAMRVRAGFATLQMVKTRNGELTLGVRNGKLVR
jgi:hypothetical protein